ncbi:MAG: PDGLE domain-containing protein [Candidatus Omnitrophica bacterium]|nr:PDGLE domain-containing protein [Candidatus Omnitrophota bacterium]
MRKKDIVLGLLAALFLAFVLSPFASPWPDGLERVAEDKGFLEKGEVEPALASPMPDYAWPGIKSERMATSMAGVVGTLIVFGAGYGIAALLKKNEEY